MRAWRHAPVYDPRRGAVSTWVLTIARNLTIDALRMRRAVPTDPDDLINLGLVSNEASPEGAALSADAARGCACRAGRARAEQRRALVLAYFYGMTAAEISEAESIPLGTAKTRIRAGLTEAARVDDERREPSMSEDEMGPVLRLRALRGRARRARPRDLDGTGAGRGALPPRAVPSVPRRDGAALGRGRLDARGDARSRATARLRGQARRAAPGRGGGPAAVRRRGGGAADFAWCWPACWRSPGSVRASVPAGSRAAARRRPSRPSAPGPAGASPRGRSSRQATCSAT